MASWSTPEPPGRGRLGLRRAADAASVAAALARARLRLGRERGRDLVAAPAPARLLPPAAAAAVADRAAWAVPRVAARVPWRADCFVRALAAQDWLARRGVASTIRLGARRGPAGLEAHAWLTVGDRVLVGGEAGHFDPFAPGAP